MYLLLKMVVFHGYVSLPEGTAFKWLVFHRHVGFQRCTSVQSLILAGAMYGGHLEVFMSRCALHNQNPPVTRLPSNLHWRLYHTLIIPKKKPRTFQNTGQRSKSTHPPCNHSTRWLTSCRRIEKWLPKAPCHTGAFSDRAELPKEWDQHLSRCTAFQILPDVGGSEIRWKSAVN